jgi:hypothetical protein
MNYNILRYRLARNALAEARRKVEYLAAKPVCLVSAVELNILAASEGVCVDVPKMIDRLRFLAKHDRSKYTPHQGKQEKSRRFWQQGVQDIRHD